MKIKLLILALVSIVILNSCSSDREEENVKNAPEQAMKNEKTLNNLESKSNEVEESVLKNDSIRKGSSVTSGTVPLTPAPEDGEVVDPTKPDKPW